MEKKALYNLSYGVFMLSTRSGEKVNGCITNTCMQVANDPVRIAISVLNSNYTCDLIKERGIFALSLLDVECSFETIKHFGFQSGRDVDKMKDLTLPVDQNNIPYMYLLLFHWFLINHRKVLFFRLYRWEFYIH